MSGLWLSVCFGGGRPTVLCFGQGGVAGRWCSRPIGVEQGKVS